jgi:hypothetical protein
MCFEIDISAAPSNRKKAYKALRIDVLSGKLKSPHKPFEWEPGVQYEIPADAVSMSGTQAHQGFYVFDSLKGATAYADDRWSYYVIVECAVTGHLHTSMLNEWSDVPGRAMTFRTCKVTRIVSAVGVRKACEPDAYRQFLKMRRRLNAKKVRK